MTQIAYQIAKVAEHSDITYTVHAMKLLLKEMAQKANSEPFKSNSVNKLQCHLVISV